jgi:Flp pilus assembly protein TadG
MQLPPIPSDDTPARRRLAFRGPSSLGNPRWRRLPRRRGVETLEVIVALPVLFFATLAVFEFGIALLIQQAVATAAIEGAREAALEGATTTIVAEKVRQYLVVHGITLDTTTVNATDDARLIVENGFLGTTEQRGNSGITCIAQGPSPSVTQVRVTLCVRMTDGNNHPIPNWLQIVGFTLTGKRLEISAIAPIE